MVVVLGQTDAAEVGGCNDELMRQGDAGSRHWELEVGEGARSVAAGAAKFRSWVGIAVSRQVADLG